MILSVLDKKVIRDLLRLWAQALAIAMVLACGVATIVISVGTYRSLDETRSAFYERYRFASVFSSVVRAPRQIGRDIEHLSGVSSVELRITKPVLLDIEGMSEPASGLVTSLPGYRKSRVNQLYLRSGRLPEPTSSSEVAVAETFAKAHGFKAGDSFKVIMNGKKRDLEIVGTVLSPEHIYAIGPGDMVPDNRRFGIFYMAQKTLAGIYDMENAFNNIALTTLRDANHDRLISKLDDILEPYGGTGAYARKDQFSHSFLDAELDQLYAMARIIPPIFLFVAAFLVNMILTRLIALEREQIGLFKALGYSNFAVGWHYAKLVVAIALVGLVIGSGFGFWAGRGLTRLYAGFFAFPFLIFKQSIDLYVIAGGLSIAAALAGAARTILAIVKLPPAVAMRPPAPTTYGGLILGEFLTKRLFNRLTIMALRHLIRWPVRTGLTILGTSLSVALLIASLFSYDSIAEMIDIVFFQTERQDATVFLTNDSAPKALYAIANLPGVLKVEPFRQAPATFSNKQKELRMAIIGVPHAAQLSRVLDQNQKPIDVPENGLIVSNRVAAKLDLNIGDMASITLTEKNDRIVQLPLVALAQSYVGLTAYTNIDTLNRLLLDGDRISGARVFIDQKELQKTYREIKKMPLIASIALQDISRIQFQNTIEKNITTMTAVYVALAVIISFGVVYNSARIQLSERARELASLRVFGFTRAEVSGVLMKELGIMVALAQPLGWALGWGFAWSIVRGFESDLFRIPLVIDASTFATSSLVVVGAALVSALIVRRRIDRLDLIRVLKTRE